MNVLSMPHIMRIDSKTDRQTERPNQFPCALSRYLSQFIRGKKGEGRGGERRGWKQEDEGEVGMVEDILGEVAAWEHMRIIIMRTPCV